MKFEGFTEVYTELREKLVQEAEIVHSRRWQGAEIANNPMMATFELQHIHFEVDLGGMEDILIYQQDIQPELPWAEDHFLERVAGYPMNPGTHWANWSHNDKAGAASFLDDRGKFNHNYMERYWPKFAGAVEKPTESDVDWRTRFKHDFQAKNGIKPNHGIMYEYGDIKDVIALLVSDPYTRQAYLPVWFPEDTGGGAKRTPCTIGYHFLMREGKLDINYHIRSCDFHKHFLNDLYLTVRLLLWVLDRCRVSDPSWQDVRPGKFVMQIGSLHVFRGDWEKL